MVQASVAVQRSATAHGYERIALTGLLAGVVFFLLSALTFYFLGVLPGILFNPEVQSPKVIAVVAELQPLPVIQTSPYIIIAGWGIWLIGWAFLFEHISVLWPNGFWPRLWRLAASIWFLSLLFFEFQGPYNLLAEPLLLLALEMCFWAVCAVGGAAVIVRMLGRPRAV